MGRLLEIQGLTRRFGGVTAVESLDLHVDEGELVSVIGPNGAGKTTSFNLISGLDRADAGSIRFDGRAIERMRPEAIAALGLARTFQHGRVFANLSVEDNVLIGAHTRLRAARPGWPVLGPIAELALALLRPARCSARRSGVARRGARNPHLVRRSPVEPPRPPRLQPVLRQPSPRRDRARPCAAAASAAARRADRGNESDRDGRDAGPDRVAEGARDDHPVDRTQARDGDAAVRSRLCARRRRQNRGGLAAVGPQRSGRHRGLSRPQRSGWGRTGPLETPTSGSRAWA